MDYRSTVPRCTRLAAERPGHDRRSWATDRETRCPTADVTACGVGGARGRGRGRSWWKELVEPPSAACGRRQGNPAEVETESDPDVEALPGACASLLAVPRDCRKRRGKRKNLDDCGGDDDDDEDEDEEEEEEEEEERRRRRCSDNDNRKKLVRDRGLPLKRTHGDTRMGRLLAATRPPCPCPGLRPPDRPPHHPPGRRASAPPPPPPPPSPPPPPLTSAKVRLKMWGRGRGRARGSGPWERGKSRPPGAVCLSDAQTQTDEGTPSCSDPSTSESSADQGGMQPCSVRLHTTPAMGTGMGMVKEEGDSSSSTSDACSSSKDSSQRLVTPAGYPRHSFRASAARLPSLCDPPPMPGGGISGVCPPGRAGIGAGGRGGQRRRRMASPADNMSMRYTDRPRRRRRGMDRDTHSPPQDCQENWSCLIF